MTDYLSILTETHPVAESPASVGLVRLNRPASLNALSSAMMDEIGHALATFDCDDSIGCMVVTGSEKAFAAGADIREMASRDFSDIYLSNFMGAQCDRLRTLRKPVIAAVSGYALGGGCELAMMCDFILASDTAKFGQPEITLGTLPGMGGTQLLTRAIGRAKAMEMCLTGRFMSASEAETAGLVARVIPAADFMAEVLKTAGKIAAMPRIAALMIKESVNAALETGLTEGLQLERRLFHASFATSDRFEGMTAFLEKRPAHFKNA